MLKLIQSNDTIMRPKPEVKLCPKFCLFISENVNCYKHLWLINCIFQLSAYSLSTTAFNTCHVPVSLNFFFFFLIVNLYTRCWLCWNHLLLILSCGLSVSVVSSALFSVNLKWLNHTLIFAYPSSDFLVVHFLPSLYCNFCKLDS